MYQQVQPQKGYELVMNQIKERIIAGVLLPGERLNSVVDLATHFGVGRSTIREALSALKAMGWIQIRQGGGTFVSQTLPHDASEAGGSPAAFNSFFEGAESIKEILEVRKIFETGCASLAAEKRTEQDLQELKDILDYMLEHLSDETIGEQADVRFHLKIAEAAHNATLLNMMHSLSQNMQETMRNSRKLWFYSEHASAKRLYQEHLKIYEAIKNQQGALASKRMLEHLSKVEKVLLKVMT